ncbi:hypothetical protein WJX73_000821 [Symbiochloris irregularis]|uniref:C2 NT-type domain-containing protein n=1 Tax=Symbiochloris irregularis TaxID=706552 RepID=A0AAW1P9B9_9CHLO
MSRRLKDLGQKTMGKRPLRFQIDLTPVHMDDVPPDIDMAAFSWERGPKMQYTDSAAVSAVGRRVTWNQTLRQTCTVFKDGKRFTTKPYKFKMQSVSEEGERRKTFAKTTIDLAMYCKDISGTNSQEVVIHMEPQGVMLMHIDTLWLKNADADQDSATEDSSQSGSVDNPHQDLRGFDDGSTTPGRQHVKSRSFGPATEAARARYLPGGSTPSPPGQSMNARSSSMHNLARGSSSSRMQPFPGVPGDQQWQQQSQAHSQQGAGTPYDSTPASTPSASPMKGHMQEGDEEAPGKSSSRRWFRGKSAKNLAGKNSGSSVQLMYSHAPEPEASGQSQEIQLLHAPPSESNADLEAALQQAFQELDSERTMRRRAEQQAEAQARAKEAMQKRLQVAEERLATLNREHSVQVLVESKLKLAQADYYALELQGALSQEQARSQVLRKQLTALEADFQATLERISQPVAPRHRYSRQLSF